MLTPLHNVHHNGVSGNERVEIPLLLQKKTLTQHRCI